MSGTSTPPPAPVSNPPRAGVLITSIWSMALLAAALALAFLTKNDNLLVLLVGVIATNATTVVNFYMGSSASSQAKDATISSQLPPPPKGTP